MTLKDKLPDRLKCSPLLTMESDSDIETIAESIVNLSDSDGDFFKKTEKLLLMACLGYLRDWCEPSQRTIGNLISLLDAALPKDNETHTTLDNLFYEMKSGCKRVKSEDGITTLWEPSALSRCDGLTPRDSNGIDASEDFSLTCYEGFRHAATRETRTSIAEMRSACHAALENVYGSEFTDALESGYDLNAESHDCASGSAVLETCDTTRAEQPMNHVKGVR